MEHGVSGNRWNEGRTRNCGNRLNFGHRKECKMIKIRKQEGTVKNKEQKNEISIRNLGAEGTMETEGTVENI